MACEKKLYYRTVHSTLLSYHIPTPPHSHTHTHTHPPAGDEDEPRPTTRALTSKTHSSPPPPLLRSSAPPLLRSSAPPPLLSLVSPSRTVVTIKVFPPPAPPHALAARRTRGLHRCTAHTFLSLNSSLLPHQHGINMCAQAIVTQGASTTDDVRRLRRRHVAPCARVHHEHQHMHLLGLWKNLVNAHKFLLDFLDL